MAIPWARAWQASKPARSSRAISRAIPAMSLSAIAASSPFSARAMRLGWRIGEIDEDVSFRNSTE
jgi:hypothetical protein